MPRFEGILVEKPAMQTAKPRFAGKPVEAARQAAPNPERTITVGNRKIPLAEYQAMSADERQAIRNQIAEANPSVREDGEQPKMTGLLANAGAGFDNAVNTVLGAPVDLPVWVGNSLINATNSAVEMANGSRPIPNIPTDLPGSREKWEQTQESLGFTPPSAVEATTIGDRLVRGATDAVGQALVPELALVRGVQAVQKGANVVAPIVRQGVDALAPLFGAGSTAPRMAANTAVNAAAGAGAQAGVELAPDGFEMPAAIAGGLIAGTPVAAATAVPDAAKLAANVAGDHLAPLTQSGRERMAAKSIADKATDVGAVRGALDQPVDIVAGSKPTTFQATGDMGLGGLERAVATRNPEPFMQRRAEQNNARVDALQNIQVTGAPEQVASGVRTFIKAIDDETQAAIDSVTARGQNSVAAVTQAGDAAVAGSVRNAQDAASGVGVGRTPDVVGDDLRAALETARGQAKESERALWKAVDPDGSLSLPVASTRNRVQAIRNEMTDLSAKPDAIEAGIYSDIMRVGDGIQPFRAVTDLDSRVKEALRAERLANGESTAYRRLSQLKSAIETDLDAAVAGKVAQERQAVQTGQMSFEQTIEANLLRQRDEWASARTQGTTGLAGEARPSSNGRGGAAALPGARGTAGEASRGLRPTEGDQGLPADAGGGNFDQGALDRLREARGATRERVATFDNQTLAPLRQRPATTSPYTMGSSAVPQKLFFPGAKSADAIATYRNAVGDRQAMALLSDYIVDRLRRVALRDDGTLDPNKVAAFQRNHSDALRAFPQLNARFGFAADASSSVPATEAARSAAVKQATKNAEEEIALAAARRKQALDTAQKGALGKLLGQEDPADVVRIVGAIFGRQDAVREMSRLREAVGDNKQAQEGLRKAVVDFVNDRFVGNTSAGTTDQNLIKADGFQTFVGRNKGALKAAGLSDAEVKAMDAIADDLRRSNQSISAVKLPGGSNTAQDAFAAKINDTPSTLFAKIIGAGAASGGASTIVLGPVLGIPVGLATSLVAAMRQAGLEKIDDIVKDAMLNPERARLLLMRDLKPREASKLGENLAQQYRRAAVVAASQSEASPQ